MLALSVMWQGPILTRLKPSNVALPGSWRETTQSPQVQAICSLSWHPVLEINDGMQYKRQTSRPQPSLNSGQPIPVFIVYKY